MSDAAVFSTAATTGTPDPDKRVRYSLGQILGADDLEQEQFHFLSRDRQHNRSLHGYGTANGLALSLAGTELRVEPGLALTPAGCVVGVPARQCADFAAWVAANAGALKPPVDAAGTRLAHVVLRYRECDTDRLPLAVTPCCGDGEGIATRITESFHLEISVEPPPAAEEAAVGRFGRFLRGLRSAPASGTPLDADGAAARVRSLIAGEAAGPWVVAAAALDAVFVTAFRVWITEVRPQLHVGNNPPLPDANDGVLLGTLRFRLDGAALLAGSTLLDEGARPLLLSTRALQELRGGSGADAPLPAAAVQPELDYGQPLVVGSSSDYARADHSHGTPPLPVPAGDVGGSIGANRIAALQGKAVAADAPGDGQVLTFDAAGQRWIPRPAPGGGGVANLGGDASGPASANTVVGLQGRMLAGDAPADGNVLTWSEAGQAWLPRPPAAAPANGLVRIVAGGLIGMNGAVGLTLGRLQLVDRNPVVFSFDGYAEPNADTRHNYVVKAMAAVKFGQAVPVIGFGGFTDKGIVLVVGFGTEPRAFDDDMQIMVEVTEILRPIERPQVLPGLDRGRVDRVVPGRVGAVGRPGDASVAPRTSRGQRKPGGGK